MLKGVVTLGKTVWKNELVFEAYELAKTGMQEKEIAEALGISFGTFVAWEKKNPYGKQLKKVFGTGIEKARKVRKELMN